MATVADNGTSQYGESVREDAALAPAAEELLQDMFGNWAREEAGRTSVPAEMLRAAIREDLKANLGAIVSEAL